MMQVVSVGDLTVDVIWKDIKNLHLSVHPPTGRIRIAAPHTLGLDAIRAFAISRLRWIRKNQQKLVAQPREAVRDYIDRESHYVWGERVLLRVIHHDGPPSIQQAHRSLLIYAPSQMSRDERHAFVEGWYRERLRQAAAPIIERWEKQLGVTAKRLFVQRMKTKWGSCQPDSGNIRLNTELARKPPECLEYVVLHELAHLRERTHTDAFYRLLDSYLPQWRDIQRLLNNLPLSDTSRSPGRSSS
ncbi:MAG: M48 family metallopeptidase [Rhizobiales bacterium]|nr:M48 family metallopeptidase [Hyphomicrobiales bacterium]